MDKIVRYGIIFLCVILLQILIFNNIPAIGMISPYLYLLFILVLPVNLSQTLVLFLSFIIGLIVDLSFTTPGVHACASIWLALCRPTILRIMQPRQGYEANNVPIVANFGTPWALRYIAVCVLVHHIVLYFCFLFTVEGLGFTFIRMCINVLLTVLVIYISEKFVIKK